MLFSLDKLKPSFGAFVKESDNFTFIPNTSGRNSPLQFTISDTKSGNHRILQLKAKNVTNRTIFINSLVVAEFLIPNFSPDQVLENGWQQCSFSGYRNKVIPTRKKRFILYRDENSHSFLPEYGYLDKSLVSEWFTELKHKEKSLVIGAITTSEQFSQIYVREESAGTRVRITCQFDSLPIEKGKTFVSEKIALILDDRKKSLTIFADLLMTQNKLKSLWKPIKGLCCAYYFQGNIVDEKYLLDQLHTIDKLHKKIKIKYIQIDAGYSSWGDWLDTGKKFPSGMKFVVDEIKKRGMKAGIWIAPFVANPKSNLFKNHPDWFLKNSKGNHFEARSSSPLDFLPPLSFRALDPTHPKVKEHLTQIIKTFVSWGFELIKIDFTYTACFGVKYHQPVTRAKALRIGLETIRKAAGEKIHILSGISPLSPLLGIVDSARVGLDSISPQVCKFPIIRKIVNSFMLRENLRNCEARQFFNNKIWINDADCFVCRPNTGLSRILQDKHFEFIRNYGGSVWFGDNLKLLDQERISKYVVSLSGNNKSE